MTVSVPASAPPIPPDTGASTIRTPAASAFDATSDAVKGSIVDESIHSKDLLFFSRYCFSTCELLLCNIPLSPVYTSTTCGDEGNIVIIQSTDADGIWPLEKESNVNGCVHVCVCGYDV